jgi:hypothetical protein
MVQVGFSHANGFWSFLSAVIMRMTGRTFSHCWMLLTGEHGILGTDVVLTEDENGGLHFVPWVGYSAGKTIVTVLDVPFDLTPGAKALINKLGTGYDYTGLFGEAYTLTMFRWFKRKVANPLANAGKMWCSESIYYALMQIPAFGIPANTSDQVDPGVLYDTLIASGAKPAAGYQAA